MRVALNTDLLKTINLVVQLEDYALMTVGVGGSPKNTACRDQKFLCRNLSLKWACFNNIRLLQQNGNVVRHSTTKN